MFAGGGVPVVRKVSVDELNSDKNRIERLRQEELGKVGESDLQRAARLVPFVGPSLDYHYDKISGEEFVRDQGKEALELGATVMGEKLLATGVGKLYAFGKARFARNLKGAYSVSTRQANREAAIIGSVDKVKIGGGTYNSYNRDALGSMNTALRQRTLLAFEDAGMITREGQLTGKATSINKGNARKVCGFDELGNPEAKDAMLKLSPNGEWGKYTTRSIKVLDGQSAEMHFYMDVKTEQTYLRHDFKIKVNSDKGAALFKPLKEKGKK